MFGTLKPQACGPRLPVVQREYRQFYCGTCKSLGSQFGLPYRALLSHDAVFLGLLVDGLQEEAAAPDRCVCPMVPVATRATVSPDSVAMRYAATMQMLLADQWLADRAIDGRALARVARPITSRLASGARETLATLGVSLAELEGFEHRQAASEVVGVTGPAQAAAPTAEALAFVFQRVAGLPGICAPARADEVQRGLARLGAAVGTAIYLIDALEDLPEDFVKGDFNPCLEGAAGAFALSRTKIEGASAALRAALREIRAELGALPLRRHREVLRSILIGRLGSTGGAAIAGAAALLQEEREAALRRWRETPWVKRQAIRSGALAASVLMVFWTWLIARVGTVAAAVRGRPNNPVDSVGDRLDLGTPSGYGDELPTVLTPEELLPPVEPLPPVPLHPIPETTPEAPGRGAGSLAWCCDFDDRCARPCGGCFEECGKGCSDCSELDCDGCCAPCSACGELCDGCECDELCNDCGKPCESCCDGCTDSCDACGDCDQCCEGCDVCGDCGNACGDCGNSCGGCGNACGDCGKGCNDCGNGCNDCGNGCNNCGAAMTDTCANGHINGPPC